MDRADSRARYFRITGVGLCVLCVCALKDYTNSFQNGAAWYV
jgi:hypothetical protein